MTDKEQLREAGRRTHRARVCKWTDPWFASVQAAWVASRTDASIHAVSARHYYTYTTPTSDAEILAVLRSWACLQSQQAADASHLPKHAWMYLRDVLPPRGLLPFFRRNHHAIHFWKDGKTTLFKLKEHAASGAPSANVLSIRDDDEDDEQTASGASSSGVPAQTGVRTLLGDIEGQRVVEGQRGSNELIPACGGQEETRGDEVQVQNER